MTNANTLKFHPSSMGGIMPADKPRGLWTQTQEDKLIEIYTDLVDGRREELSNKYLTKGNLCEEDNVTLLSRVLTKKLGYPVVFKKNESQIENDYFIGTPDLFIGESIKNADETFDTKTSWSRITFNKARVHPLNPDYKFQGHSYMDLTGAKKHNVVYGLVNGLANDIINAKSSAAWAMGIPNSKDNGSLHELAVKHPELMRKFKQIERNHIFDIKLFEKHNPGFELEYDLKDWTFDIPMEDRVHLKSFERSEQEIEKMYIRINQARQWINEKFFTAELVAA